MTRAKVSSASPVTRRPRRPAEDEGVVRADLRSADQDARARRPPLHLARKVQAALAVPQIEREPDQLRLVPGDPVGEQRVAQRVGRGRLQDVDLEPLLQSVHAGGDAQATGRQRNLPVAANAAGGGTGSWTRRASSRASIVRACSRSLRRRPVPPLPRCSTCCATRGAGDLLPARPERGTGALVRRSRPARELGERSVREGTSWATTATRTSAPIAGASSRPTSAAARPWCARCGPGHSIPPALRHPARGGRISAGEHRRPDDRASPSSRRWGWRTGTGPATSTTGRCALRRAGARRRMIAHVGACQDAGMDAVLDLHDSGTGSSFGYERAATVEGVKLFLQECRAGAGRASALLSAGRRRRLRGYAEPRTRPPLTCGSIAASARIRRPGPASWR